MGHILRMKPAFVEKIWGGHKLRDVFHYNIPSDRTGEAWVISAHKNGQSIVDGGEFDGMTLNDVYQNHRELFGNIPDQEFPLLVKLIDASDDLSVQVHPDDVYAAQFDSLGKTESWYIIDRDPGTKIIVGHNAQTEEEFVHDIETDNWDHLLRRFPIENGDFFYIPSGTVHAICKGTLLYEAQQSSDITYRLYDYHRKDDQGNERELHLKESIDVSTVPWQAGNPHAEDKHYYDHYSVRKFLSNPYLSVCRLKTDGEAVASMKREKPFYLVTVLDGTGTLNGVDIKPGDNLVVCSDVDTMDFDGQFVILYTTL